MITEQDLQEAIAECQGVRNPTMNTCVKLAALYTIRNEMFGKTEQQMYSYSTGTDVKTYHSDSEFWQKAQRLDADDLMAVIDDLMDTLSVVNPRLYDAVMRKM